MLCRHTHSITFIIHNVEDHPEGMMNMNVPKENSLAIRQHAKRCGLRIRGTPPSSLGLMLRVLLQMLDSLTII